MVANYLTGTAFMLIVLLILFIKICNDMKQEKSNGCTRFWMWW